MDRFLNAERESDATSRQAAVAADVAAVTTSSEYVITDDQFIAGLANRATPPMLVDTSFVRILSGDLSSAELERYASNPCTAAVLFFTRRLSLARLVGFRDLVARNYRRVKSYGPHQQLWMRAHRSCARPASLPNGARAQ